MNERTALLYENENENEDENKAAELLMNVECWAMNERTAVPYVDVDIDENWCLVFFRHGVCSC